MKNFRKNIQKNLVLAGIFAFLMQLPAIAFDGAVLKGINISRINNEGYRVIIKTDKDVPIKKYVTATNKVVLDLQNVRPAEFVNTVYNNAAEIDHVIVQPYSGNKLRIFIQGLDIISSKIILDTRDEALSFLPSEIPVNVEEETMSLINKTSEKTTTNPIFIDLSEKPVSKTAIKTNNSIDKVKSVTPIISYGEQSRNNYAEVKNSMREGYSENNILGASPFDWILRILMLAAIIVSAVKMFGKPKKVEVNLASDNIRNRELELYKSVENRKELLTRSLGNPGYKQNTLKKPNYSSISQYGLKEYQNSQLPPRKMTPPTPMTNLNNNSAKLNYALQNKKSATAGVKEQPVTRQLNQSKITKRQTEEAKANFDGTKFLESMASIYQKSGRDDLAVGIRQNLIKKQDA